MKSILNLFAAFALACSSFVNAHAQPRYNVTILPGLENAVASSLNNLGEVVGFKDPYNYYYYSSVFLYSNGLVIDLGTFSGDSGHGSLFADINDHSQIVGLGGNTPFLYSNGTETILCPDCYGQYAAYAINNGGQIVGYANSFAAIFSEGTEINIPNAALGVATSINDNYGADGFGQIVGLFNAPSENATYGFLYSDGVTQNIGISICSAPFPNSFFSHINNVGQIVGYCYRYSDFNDVSVFLYDIGNESYESLGSITPGTYEFGTPDINDAGQVVGTLDSGIPFLFMNGQTYNLLDLVPAGSNLTGFTPAAINNKGQIVGNILYGSGQNEKSLNVVLLTPIRQPQIYSVTSIPSSTLTDLNNLGDAVGYSTVLDNQQAFLRYANGTTIDLGTLGGLTSMANAINDARQVVGQSALASGITHAFVWFANATIVDLSTLEGPTGTSVANAINRIGQIVGQSSSSSSSSAEAVVFWKGSILGLGALSTTGASTATSINNVADPTGLGQIIGQADSNYGEQAFFYASKTMADLGHTICPDTYSSSEVVSINDVGYLAGNCYNGSSSLAFVYDIKNQQSTFIGTGGSKVADMNNAGQAVGVDGSTPFFYVDGVEYNLYDYIPSSAGITGLVPVAINNQGQIAANSDQGGVLLTTANEAF